MRIEVDYSRCAGLGLCEVLVPDVFEVDDRGDMHVHAENVKGTAADRLQHAVDSCPTAALRLVP
jgi:ferredoxin